MEEAWREILIDVEPRGKEFRLGIDDDACAADVLNVIAERCLNEGISIEGWAKKQVGSDYQFVLLRKGEGNAILPPNLPFAEVFPVLENSERFTLGTQPVVGALPTVIFNNRMNNLVDEFYESSLRDIYKKNDLPYILPSKKKIGGNIQNS